MFDNEPLVSVIIPCYNQASFLGEAIESILSQTYRAFEILVIDDGSTDRTGEIAAAYSTVRYFCQENRGPSAARNLGVSQCRGEYLVFLDADDRLLPQALESGVACLNESPQCAFASGRYRLIDGAGFYLPTWSEIRWGDESGITSSGWELIGPDGSILERKLAEEPETWDHYAALLQRNYIEMPSTVIYRKNMFLEAGGFDPTLRAAEDYDLFLRIARQYPVTCYNYVSTEYRQHDSNTTRDKGAMLIGALKVLDRQRAYVRRHEEYRKGLSIGVAAFFDHYGLRSILRPFTLLKPAAWGSAFIVIRSILDYGSCRFQNVYRRVWYRTPAGLKGIERELDRRR